MPKKKHYVSSRVMNALEDDGTLIKNSNALGTYSPVNKNHLGAVN